ncbi:hypothetical protein ACFHW0_20545 [Micromonospora sp. LOL_025]|uniref:hypothetical protein n=1 Tax=Micromonospora sp. LOL_025 TaxID=3345413 RepID=UPI003A84FAED
MFRRQRRRGLPAPVVGKRHAFGLHSRSNVGRNNAASNKKKAWFSAMPNFWNTLAHDLG